ncbi:hypothetical protein [Chitinibacter sp. GC72]|uniref:hypothetical protein n=1 Tax=Chitinibacter sp. GC72 TaxID=1526917 RepID=UPI0012F90313|nr:hypothetical protein [Chitinibacter sp. GC72]
MKVSVSVLLCSLLATAHAHDGDPEELFGMAVGMLKACKQIDAQNAAHYQTALTRFVEGRSEFLAQTKIKQAQQGTYSAAMAADASERQEIIKTCRYQTKLLN